MDKESIDKLTKAGIIAQKVKVYALELIKPDMFLLEIAEKIEAKIIELGGKPAFPVNLSMNEIAAHSTPSYDDKKKSSGLLKVDLGVRIDGIVADTALTLDLENSDENKTLIETAKKALENALKIIKSKVEIKEIGKEIEKTIRSKGFQPIINLSGHSIDEYSLHSGTTIPNYDNHQTKNLEPGVYAIEPFVTSGLGNVRDGRPSNIFVLKEETKNVRDIFTRTVLSFIREEYKTLPFCSRWIVKKFGSRAIIALKNLEDNWIIYQYPQLIEVSGKKVAQAEHTILVTEKETNIIT